MTKQYIVRLTREERQRLETMLSAGHGSIRRLIENLGCNRFVPLRC